MINQGPSDPQTALTGRSPFLHWCREQDVVVIQKCWKSADLLQGWGKTLPDSHKRKEKRSLKTLSFHWHGFQVLKDFGKKGQPLLRYFEIRAEWATLSHRLWEAVFPLLNLSGNVYLACSGQIISDNPWQPGTVSRGSFWAWRCQWLSGDVRECLGATLIAGDWQHSSFPNERRAFQ